MPSYLGVVTLFLVSVAMGLSLAHVLEFPGKLRLDEASYREVQAIYYPGFAIGGLVGEVGGIIMLAALLYLTPVGSVQFTLNCAALVFLIACHASYWVVTHPVNQAWLKQTDISGAGRLFFGFLAASPTDWQHMRNVWEWSHVVRACFATFGFLSLALSIAG